MSETVISTIELATQYADMKRTIKQRESELDEIKKKADCLEDVLQERFTRDGIHSIRLQNDTSVYLRRDVRASLAGDRNVAMEALTWSESAGSLVHQTVNLNTLSAWVREQVDLALGEKAKIASPQEMLAVLPEDVRSAILVSEQFSVRVTN